MTQALVSTLSRVALARGVAAVAIGAYVLGRMPMSRAEIARAIALYWIVDGAVVLSSTRLAASLTVSPVLVLLRGIVAIAAGLAIFGLPLDAVFGPWRPGHVLIVTTVTAMAFCVIALQILAATVDGLVRRAVRRHIPRDWSVTLGAALSVALALGAAATFAMSPTALALGVGAVSLGAGLALLAGAVILFCTGSAVTTDTGPLGDVGDTSTAASPRREHVRESRTATPAERR